MQRLQFFLSERCPTFVLTMTATLPMRLGTNLQAPLDLVQWGLVCMVSRGWALCRDYGDRRAGWGFVHMALSSTNAASRSWAARLLTAQGRPRLLIGGDAGCVDDVVAVAEGATGQGGAEDAPPAFLEVEPAGADRDEDVLDAWVVLEPGARGQRLASTTNWRNCR
ncbi:hypothetical protein OG895_18375 [Streptomyces sp. NBC_00201]|uniref:hypothetical protein n=1 Tax=Streptomyces sp. NBC_00201 TaxID=2975679 RepID=UPI00224D4B10|nr:hypothetical protein [Streptomyces sp. NBC_00201]MCX5247165.1 hypothetical protein [Streptomyces sp. NBC_00201]